LFFRNFSAKENPVIKNLFFLLAIGDSKRVKVKTSFARSQLRSQEIARERKNRKRKGK